MLLLPARPTAALERTTLVGQQFLTAGLVLTPGFFYDPTGAEHGRSRVMATGGGTARVGLQHWVARSFDMAVELELGPQWFDDHTASADAAADSEWALGWQIGLIGRWVPGPEPGNFSAGLGMHVYRAGLDDAPLQSLAADARLGWFVWRKDNFALVEFGYAVPFLTGLDFPTDFTGEAEPPAARDWTLHRFSVGFSYGF